MKPVVVALALLAAPPLALPAAAGAADGRQAEVVYDIYAGGLHALNLDMALKVDGQRYRVQGDLRTMGTVDVMVRWRSAQETTGRLIGGKARPERHHRAGEWRLNKRETRIDYDGEGTVAVSIDPPPEDDDRPPVPAELRHGTVDFMSAMLQASLAETPAAACRDPVRIFDGRRRYDMTFTPAGEEMLKPTRYGAFNGAAMRCLIDLHPIAGFRPDDERETGLGFPKTVTVWLVRNEATGLVLPVRLHTATQFGAVVVHLSQVAGADSRQAGRLN